MIKNIVFDIGSVLVYFGPRELMKKLGFSEAVIDKLIKDMVMSPYWIEFDRGILSDEEIIAGFKKDNVGLEKKIDLFLEHKEELIEQFDYVDGWIKGLKEKGYKTYFLSNYPKTFFDCHSKNRFKFLPLMDGGIVSGRVKLIKPDLAIYECLLSTYHLKPEECVFIDDVEKNIVAARAVGMKGIVFNDYRQACQELETLLMTSQ